MKDEQVITVFLVDDDVLLLRALEIEFLEKTSFKIETFSTGEICLENIGDKPDMVVLDYHLDGVDRNAMNGLQTLDRIKALHPEIPVIMLSSQDKIEVAINCMHHHALDYIVKSETAFFRLQKIINTIIANKKMEKELSWYMDRM